ncbi:MAG: hypothetical protein U9Q04_07055 [Campylobacterota bacterium]|nr:hypothetical protein [Campylobacterota bacterium]
MFEEEKVIKIYATTFNKVLRNLATIEDCPLEELEDRIIEEFDEYNYEGEDEVIGFDTWGDISLNGEYELKVKIDHEDAYEITLFVNVDDKKVTVNNVL